MALRKIGSRDIYASLPHFYKRFLAMSPLALRPGWRDGRDAADAFVIAGSLERLSRCRR